MKDDHGETVKSQQTYTSNLSGRRDLGFIIPESFIRGIRHIGYRGNVEAIAELIDNSMQAYAERVDLVFGYKDSASKPAQLAVIDDGHGMGPDMVRFAMMWGGTHRENDRGGLGRFGYGLPCSTVSMGRRFTVYSKLRRGRIHAVTLDLDMLDDDGYRNAQAETAMPSAQPAILPGFLRESLRRIHPGGWKSGTIVLVEKLDRLEWTTRIGLRRNLMRHFGVAYHKLLRATALHVDGEQVHPIDPLFLSPDGEFHALDVDRAHALDPVTFRIEGGGASGGFGEVTLRYAWLPPTFGATDKSRDAIGINANARFPIIKQYHGIIFSRNGRLVDVKSRTPWTSFINNDRYIRIEIEFSASLDEAFGVTTSKQQVSVSPDMWNRLRVAGLHKAIEHLRAMVRIAKAERQSRPTDRTNTGIAKPSTIREPLATGGVRTRGELLRRRRRALGPDGLVAAMRSIVATADPAAALDTLLSHIGQRMAEADTAIVVEYERLLRQWARQTATSSPEPKNRPGNFVHATHRLAAGVATKELALLSEKRPKGSNRGT
ncbi:ATP-binding protein [Methylobacterium sp. 1030]|uniref:ATP-binding protein n=1 Tax=Methylobacterium sp. 1030 TaxID=3156404 RepID=UPI00339B7DBA